MISVRHAEDRGRARLDWLDSRHSFSFGDYRDPGQTGFSILRVINEDRVAPAGGFATHGHRDMEILSYVLAGALEHRDSMGNGSVIRPGDVQRMSAGTGVRHSEYNPSQHEPVHFLQIWLLPNRTGVEPGYDQRHFPDAERRGRLRLLVSPDGRDGSIAAHQDGLLSGALLGDGETLEQRLSPGRRGYVHLARGSAQLNGVTLEAGDGARIEDGAAIRLAGAGNAEFLVFDLP